MFVKLSSFATPKTELLLSINLLLCTSSRNLVVVQITCAEVQYLFNIISLGPALFSDNNIGSTDDIN